MSTKINNYIKFSSYLNDKTYYTIIDLEREHVNIQENGITVFDNTIKSFKKTVANGGWLHNKVYQEILNNGEKLMEIMTKAS